MTQRRHLLAAAVLAAAIGATPPVADATPAVPAPPVVNAPPTRSFPLSTPRSVVVAAAMADFDVAWQGLATAYQAQYHQPLVPVTADERATLAAALDATLSRGPEVGAAATAEDADPVEAALETAGGGADEEESPATFIGVSPACAGPVTFKKRKLRFTPLYSSVRATLNFACNEPVLACGMAGVIHFAAMPYVIGTKNIGDGITTYTCSVQSTKAYLVSRPCAGGGPAAAVTESAYLVGVWLGFC